MPKGYLNVWFAMDGNSEHKHEIQDEGLYLVTLSAMTSFMGTPVVINADSYVFGNEPPAPAAEFQVIKFNQEIRYTGLPFEVKFKAKLKPGKYVFGLEETWGEGRICSDVKLASIERIGD